jgi:hypothetical protein
MVRSRRSEITSAGEVHVDPQRNGERGVNAGRREARYGLGIPLV